MQVNPDYTFNTAAGWASANTILSPNIVGIETDTWKFKVGDGGTAWNSLAYQSGVIFSGGSSLPCRIQIRGDLAATWTSTDPILAERELGVETDTYKIKVGDGVTVWNSLSYIAGQDSTPPHTATDAEIIAGTSTTTSTVSPAQIKSSVETFSVQLDTSGGNSGLNGTSTTAARSDHDHADATGSVHGMFPAAAKTKLDAIFQVLPRLCTFTTGNESITFTTMTAAVKMPIVSSFTTAICLKGITKVRFSALVTTLGATTSRLAVLFAAQTASPYTWIMANGAAAPANGAAAPSGMDTAYGAISLAPAATTSTVWTDVTVPSAVQSLDMCSVNLISWGGDGTLSPVCLHIGLAASGGTTNASAPVNSVMGRAGDVVAVSGDYNADQISDTTTHIMMAADERRLLHYAGMSRSSPLVYIRRLTGLDVTRDFGSYNMTGDATPDGASGTDDKAKLQGIREYLRTNFNNQEVELVIPHGRFFKISQAVNWDIQDIITHIVGCGSSDCGFVGTNSSAGGSFLNAPFNYGGVTNLTLYSQNVWRLAKGQGTGGVAVDNMAAGDDMFVAPTTADYNATSVGDWLMFVSGWFFVNGTDPVTHEETEWGPSRRWTAKVKRKLGNGYIQLDRQFPFVFEASFPTANHSGVRLFNDSTGTAVPGNAFARFADMTPDSVISTADTSYSGTGQARQHPKMFHARLNLYSLRIGVTKGYPTQGGLPLDSYWDSVYIDSDNYAIYGNAMQGCLMRNITACNRAGFIELGVVSCNNLFEDFVWTFRETALSADSGQGWILRTGEASYDNKFTRGQLLGRNKTAAPKPGTGPGVFQAYISSGMWIDQIYAELGFDGTIGWGGFTTGTGSDGGSLTGIGNRATDVYLKFTNSAFAGGGYFQCKGDGGEVRRVKVDGALSGALSAPSINGGDYCTIEDVVVKGNPAASVQNSTRSVVRRYDGTVTNNGTNTKLENNGTGKAALGKFFAGL